MALLPEEVRAQLLHDVMTLALAGLLTHTIMTALLFCLILIGGFENQTIFVPSYYILKNKVK